MNKLMDEIRKTARCFTVNLQELCGCPLDYSLESLENVDDLLEDFRGQELNGDALFNLSSLAGSYVFEVARRRYGGEYLWIEKERQPVLVAGIPDFSVGIKAWERVRGRLLNGREDNIPFYIAGYEEQIAIGMTKRDYHVTIV